MNTKKTILAATMLGALAVGAAPTQAAQITGYASPINDSSSNFTMLDLAGGMVGGTNDAVFNWSGSIFNASSDYTGPGGASNATMTSITPFYGHIWTAHDIQIFGPGGYTFDTTLGTGTPEIGSLIMNVGSGQLGMHLLFDWNGNNNIDMALVLDPNAVFGSGNGFQASPTYCGTFNPFNPLPGANCLWDGTGYGPAGTPSGSQLWMLTSVDGNGDGIPGIPMAPGGPFAGFNANFNVAPVPVPAAFWLFGSGLVGLLGMMRRRAG